MSQFPEDTADAIKEAHKNGTPIGSLDTLIAAHALSPGYTLVTNNTKEFERVPGLRLENRTDVTE